MNNEFYFKSTNDDRCFFKTKGLIEDQDPIKNSVDEKFSMADIPPFLRTLLVADGTVTKTLEAYFWEPLEVKTIRQDFDIVDQNVAWLKISAGEEIMTREVKLKGVDTDKIYVGAYSMINLDAVPEHFRGKLIDGRIGIGVLIRDSGLESYREIVDFGAEKDVADYYRSAANSSSFEFADGADGVESIDIVYRTYRIYLSGKPAILITERFPKEIYEA